jgi:hypothetical protein
MPKDLPPSSICHDYWRLLSDGGHMEQINHRLVMMDREKAGREASPTLAIIDAQSVLPVAKIRGKTARFRFGWQSYMRWRRQPEASGVVALGWASGGRGQARRSSGRSGLSPDLRGAGQSGLVTPAIGPLGLWQQPDVVGYAQAPPTLG